MEFKTFSDKQTKKIAASLFKEIAKSRPRTGKNALVIALSGDLGAGKTTFVQGFLRAAGVRKRIASPTFVLIKSYKFMYHIDCYRIKNPKELLDLGLKEILNNPKNIVLIEWAEKIRRILLKKTIWIKLKHSKKINERVLKI